MLKGRERKVIVSLIGIILLQAVCFVGAKAYETDNKEVTVQVLADENLVTKEVITNDSTLGQWVKESGMFEYTEDSMGVFVTGVMGRDADSEIQEWWCVEVNGEPSPVGASQIEIKEGDQYRFELMKGW